MKKQVTVIQSPSLHSVCRKEVTVTLIKGIIPFANPLIFRALEMVRKLFPMMAKPLLIGNPQVRGGSERIIN